MVTYTILICGDAQEKGDCRAPWQVEGGPHEEEGVIEVYGLSADISEQHNIADEHPDAARELAAMMKAASQR